MAKEDFYQEEDDDITFNIINKDTVNRLRKDGTIDMPPKKVAVPKDKRWNTKQMTSKILHGILNGSSVDDMSEAMKTVIGNNQASAIRNTRTMVTSAENHGRLDSYKNLSDQGVVMKKEWEATPDDRTRPTHIDIDGEEQDIDKPFSNGLMFPGDGNGPAEEVWMCRCAMGTHIVGFRRADGSISKVDYERDETLHEKQMKTEKRSRARSNSKYTPLYHGTTFKSMVDILKSNKLLGNISNETETFGVSTTRNKNAAYDKVRLVLDKERLQQDYKVKPIYRESVFGRDLAEERVDKTVANLNKYIREIQWNDDSKSNMQINILRNRLVKNFDNPNYTKDPNNEVYYIKQIAMLAKRNGIPLDRRYKEALKWIDRFDNRIFDEEKYRQLQKKAKERAKKKR